MAAGSGGGSGSGGGTDWVKELNDLSSQGSINAGDALTRLLFLPIAAFFVQAANAVEAISKVFINPVDSFASGLGGVADAILSVPQELVTAGTETSAGALQDFGIVSVVLAFILVFATGFLLIAFLSQEETSDLIPFSFTDIPIIGVEEED